LKGLRLREALAEGERSGLVEGNPFERVRRRPFKPAR